MKEIINVEFKKGKLGHANFQVQKEVEQMLVSFESNVIKKLETLSNGTTNLQITRMRTLVVTPKAVQQEIILVANGIIGVKSNRGFLMIGNSQIK